jgi:hypothetical protein
MLCNVLSLYKKPFGVYIGLQFKGLQFCNMYIVFPSFKNSEKNRYVQNSQKYIGYVLIFKSYNIT